MWWRGWWPGQSREYCHYWCPALLSDLLLSDVYRVYNSTDWMTGFPFVATRGSPPGAVSKFMSVGWSLRPLALPIERGAKAYHTGQLNSRFVSPLPKFLTQSPRIQGWVRDRNQLCDHSEPSSSGGISRFEQKGSWTKLWYTWLQNWKAKPLGTHPFHDKISTRSNCDFHCLVETMPLTSFYFWVVLFSFMLLWGSASINPEEVFHQTDPIWIGHWDSVRIRIKHKRHFRPHSDENHIHFETAFPNYFVASQGLGGQPRVIMLIVVVNAIAWLDPSNVQCAYILPKSGSAYCQCLYWLGESWELSR